VPAVKVLHVINQLSAAAGAETSLRNLIQESNSNRIQHAVVVLRAQDQTPPELDARGVPIIRPDNPLSGRAAMVRHSAAAIRLMRPDIVHTTLFDADLAGRVAAKWLGVPVLTSLVNTPYGTEARSAEPVSATKLRLVRLADGVLARHATTAFHAISNAVADHAVRHLHVGRELIRVVPRGRSASALGVRTTERRRRVREAMNWGSKPVVINVARQEPQKGHLQLADAMAVVLSTLPDALLVLVGREGRSTPALRERLTALGMGDSVIHLGIRHDVPDLLSAADVFAFSSLYEGLGGAVVEAAGLGLPVVSYDVPAVREILGDDHPWLTPLGDIPALACGIIQVLRGAPRVDSTIKTERARFLARYELAACVEGMTSLYQDLAEATSGRRGRFGRTGTVPVGGVRG